MPRIGRDWSLGIMWILDGLEVMMLGSLGP